MILDTNALTAFFDGDHLLEAVIANESPIHLPVVVLGEYRFGLLRSRHRRALEQKLFALAAVSFVLAVDLETTEHYADIREELRQFGRPIPANDLWIAALARQHELPVVSRDEHFDRVPRLERRSW